MKEEEEAENIKKNALKKKNQTKKNILKKQTFLKILKFTNLEMVCLLTGLALTS